MRYIVTHRFEATYVMDADNPNDALDKASRLSWLQSDEELLDRMVFVGADVEESPNADSSQIIGRDFDDDARLMELQRASGSRNARPVGGACGSYDIKGGKYADRRAKVSGLFRRD